MGHDGLIRKKKKKLKPFLSCKVKPWFRKKINIARNAIYASNKLTQQRR